MSLSAKNEAGTLRMVQIIFRHGLRTPFAGNAYPNDPNEDFLQIGIGQLTKEGRQQMYKVGEHLQERYKNLTNFDPRSIYARSSGTDRCLDSCSCFLASFCPPKGYYDWNSSLKWQPLPIITMPRGLDKVLHSTDHEGVTVRFVNPNFSVESKGKIMDLQGSIGTNLQEPMPLYCLLDGVMAQSEHHLTLEPKVDKHRQDIYDLLDEFFEGMLSRSSDILSCGNGLFEETLKNIDSNLESDGSIKNTPIKCFVYCTSDLMVIALMHILGVYNEKRMGFGSTFIIELHDIDGTPTIKLLYNGNTARDPTDFKELNSTIRTVASYRDAQRQYIENAKT